MSKRRKALLWIGGLLTVFVVFPLGLMTWAWSDSPTRDPKVVKALNAESRALLARYAGKGTDGIDVPLNQLPPTIASFSPTLVFVYPGWAVKFLTTVTPDGSYGYLIIPNQKGPQDPSLQCWEYLGDGVNWFCDG